MARVRLLAPLVLTSAPALLVACSSVWGFEQLAVGDGGAGEDATGDGTATTGEGGQGDAAGGDSTTDSPAPGTWSVVEVRFSTATPPTCGAEWAGTSWVAYDTLTAAPATCGCTCGAPTGVVCTNQVGLQGVSGGVCTGSCTPSSPVTSGQCTVSFGVHPGMECGCCLGGGSVMSAGSCSPQPTQTVPPTSWGGQARACAPTKACSGTACPTPDPTFVVCEEQSGDVSCPADHPTKHVEYSGVTDTRGCSACTCGASTASCAGGGITCYNDSACGSAITTGMCQGNGCPYVLYSVPANGSCPPSTVSPTGSATGKGATTFCCK